MNRPARSNVFFVVVVSVLSTVAGIALVGGAAVALPKKYSPYHKLNIFTRVLSYVENNYVENVDHDELIYGSIKGMLDTLDPHTSYLKPDQYKEMKVETTGEFGGIGIEVEPRPSTDGGKEKVLAVMSALEGTPAWKAGLQTGDTILRIDDIPTRNMNMDEAVRRMRGKKGTPVVVTIGRRAWKDPK